MSIILSIDWGDITPEQYDSVMKTLDLGADPPKGLQVHASAFDDSGVHITDIWDTTEDFQAFAATRLSAALASAGVSGTPPMVFRDARKVVKY